MRRLFHAKSHANSSPSDEGQASIQAPQSAATPQRRSRRGIFGWMKRVGLGLAAATGAGLLWKQTSQTAYADDLYGTFRSSTNSPAVYATGTNGATGVYGKSDTGTGLSGFSPSGYGVNGQSGSSIGVCGESGSSYGVYGQSNTGYGVYGQSNGTAIYGKGGPGAYAIFGTSTGTTSAGVYGTSDSGNGMAGTSSSGDGVYGGSTNSNGVHGYSLNRIGVHGASTNGTGVYGEGGNNSTGVYGYAFSGPDSYGVIGSGSYSGVYGYGESYAAIFYGPVEVIGTLSKGGGSFLIDHPLDPANKSLSHSFVESPDMKNIYDGIAVLDQQGEAVVTLPAWFATLNRDFRYQLTCLGSSAPVYIAQEIANNQFTIAGGHPGMNVCWLVTGIRQDHWAEAYRIPVEQDKPAEQRGKYYYPELYGQPKEKGIHQLPPLPKRP